jgi:hypothetical protein
MIRCVVGSFLFISKVRVRDTAGTHSQVTKIKGMNEPKESSIESWIYLLGMDDKNETTPSHHHHQHHNNGIPMNITPTFFSYS